MGFSIINALGIKDKNKNASLTTLARKYVLQGIDRTNKDKDLILITVPQGSKKTLRISFNGTEGTAGTLQIYDAFNHLRKESQLKLIKYPFYASLDISDFPEGAYLAELTTPKGNHMASLILQ